jgi:CRISPR-associated protein Csb2
MPLRALLFEVRLLDGRYHGVGDWPPAPFRLFQALVAGAYGGRWRSELDADKDAAFRWLERLQPPHIAAPIKHEGRATTYFVPNNDLDSVGGDPARVSEIRIGKVVRPTLVDGEASFLYAWPFDEGENHAEQLCAIAERLHTLGRGIDPAFARAETCDWVAAEVRLAAHQGRVARPTGAGSPPSDPFCPTDGSLESLKLRHSASATRFTREGVGKKAITLFRQSPKAKFRTVAYDRRPVRLLFELRRSVDPALFAAVPQELAITIAASIRDLAAARLNSALPKRSPEIDRLVVGRGAGPADIARRILVVPLPSIGMAHTPPGIRRVLVEVPPDSPFSEAEVTWALSGQNPVDSETGEIIERTILTQTEDKSMLRNYGVERRARLWHTITPAALPMPRRLGRIGGAERTRDEQHAAGAVVNALRHAGYNPRGADIRVQSEPFHRKGARADAFEPDRFTTLRHIQIRFPEPVTGPIVIGDGRFLGLGVMAPAQDERAPSIQLFAIDPATAPPAAQAQAVARALHRAVMARVDGVWRKGAARRDQALPTFFTGHEPEGAPARSGRHEHLFFFADDLDGDGRLDRLAVVSPHVADRTFGRDLAERRQIEDHLRTLDRALRDFTTLRAGKAGVLSLAPAETVEDGDPVFGRTRSLVSRTLYAPTHHTRRASAEEAVRRDLTEECARRGLPRPEVDVLAVDIGPRGGLAARVRLRFRVAIKGPVLLGRGSHFGAGLFVAAD